MKKTAKITVLLIGISVLGLMVIRLLSTNKKSSIDQKTPLQKEDSISTTTETSNYKDFSQEAYAEAKAAKKRILLYFTANWCPICKEQEPQNKKAFEELEEDSQIVAFRVHVLDNQTTKETEKLADDFEVSYQHTFVFLDSGGEVSEKYTGPLTKEQIIEKIEIKETRI